MDLMGVDAHRTRKVPAWIPPLSREVDEFVLLWGESYSVSFRPGDAFIMGQLQPQAVAMGRRTPRNNICVVHEPKRKRITIEPQKVL